MAHNVLVWRSRQALLSHFRMKKPADFPMGGDADLLLSAVAKFIL